LKRLVRGEEFQKWAFNTTIKDKEVEAVNEYKDTLCVEAESLQNTELFGEYRLEKVPFAIAMNGSDIWTCLKNNILELINLLKRLCTSKSSLPNRSILASRLSSLIQIITFTRHQRNCNFLPAITALVSHAKGSLKNLFDLTNAMGITESYRATMDSIAGLEALRKKTILDRLAEYNGKWLFVYDNLDLSINTHQQTMTRLVYPSYLYTILTYIRKKELYYYTSTIIVPAPLHPKGGLKRSMFNDSVHIASDDITDTPSIKEDDVGSKITAALVYRALKAAYPREIGMIAGRGKKNAADTMFVMPDIDLLPLPAAGTGIRPVPFFPIQLDESTVENNVEIVKDILIKQCGLTPRFFKSEDGPVIAAGGNNKTLQRL